jgi:molybdenum cofactor guanylyltransferase
MSAPYSITGGVLAGGAGRRMGGVDKGWMPFAGRPLVAWVLDALRPQVGPLLISANRSQAQYAALGAAVVSDRWPDFAGPLAGIEALLAATPTEVLLVAPCDSPRLPPDRAARLSAAQQAADADGACAVVAGRRQPLHVLLHTRVLPALRAALDAGERSPQRWYGSLHLVDVPFDEDAAGFLNANTPDDLAALAATFPQEHPA